MLDQSPTDRRNFKEFAAKLFRYAFVTIGPVGTAGTQFILSLQMLHTLEPRWFGVFSFLLVVSQFSCGAWSALFCAPLPILVHAATGESKLADLRCLFSSNGLGAIFALLTFWLIGVTLDVPNSAAAVFGFFAAVTLLRWFARQHAYVTGNALRTVLSDVVYSIALFAGVEFIHVLHLDGLHAPFGILLGSSLVSLAPFGFEYFAYQFAKVSFHDLLRYSVIWKKYSSWALVGVATTEFTANAHAYLVTFLVGPAAFAPLSASALLIRPIGVVMTALTDFERPQLARQIHSGQKKSINRSLMIFRLVLIATMALTAIVALILLNLDPGLIFPPRYSTAYLSQATALWMAIAAARIARTPESALLQAAGLFRPLALASVISSVVSIVIVTFLLIFGGPLFSVIGILLGEAVYAIWIHRQTYDWSKRHYPV
jgi:O-antigen/teichoic acid export membrane protein